jgi:hypothetical protein
MALLALSPAGGETTPAEAPEPQVNTVPAPEGVLIRDVLRDLAAGLDPEAEAPVSTAEAVARLEAAGMTLPAGLDPDQTLKMSDAAALVAAVGLDLNAGRAQAAVFPPGLVEGLVDLLRMALAGSPGPSQ